MESGSRSDLLGLLGEGGALGNDFRVEVFNGRDVLIGDRLLPRTL
jgi:hypothetical protein